ncbi:MAG: endonuclease/exonuclease/phosphatase family protein [Pseudomonadales bacterium]
MRILSYNIHKGFSVGNRRWVLNEIRRAIREVGADIVCLQEVVGENHHHAAQIHQWVDAQFEYLADEVWDYKTYGKNAVYDHGHHGNAILSKVPFTQTNNHDISVLPFSRRGILSTVTEDGVYVLCTHFGLLALERRYQLRCLQALLQAIPHDAPLILAGDFNDWNGRAHRCLREWGLREALSESAGALQKTYPAHLPLLCMDRVYFRNLTLQSAVCLTGAHWRRLSDHRALCVEFQCS